MHRTTPQPGWRRWSLATLGVCLSLTMVLAGCSSSTESRDAAADTQSAPSAVAGADEKAECKESSQLDSGADQAVPIEDTDSLDPLGATLRANCVMAAYPPLDAPIPDSVKDELCGKYGPAKRALCKKAIPNRVTLPDWTFTCPPYDEQWGCLVRKENFENQCHREDKNECQPWGGVTSDSRVWDKEPVPGVFETLVMSGRQASTDVATWFKDLTVRAGGSMMGTSVGDGSQPKQLNFAYCGQLHPGSQDAATSGIGLCMGQGHKADGENNWWFGGKDFTVKTVDFTAILTWIKPYLPAFVQKLMGNMKLTGNVLVGKQKPIFVITAHSSSDVRGPVASWLINNLFIVVGSDVRLRPGTGN